MMRTSTDYNVEQDHRKITLVPESYTIAGTALFKVILDGDIIVSAVPDIGMQHRSFEKIAENLRFDQIAPYADRVDIAASLHSEYAYINALEKMIGIEPSKRTEFVRVILLELQRILSHITSVAGLTRLLAHESYYSRYQIIRQELLNFFEMNCGGRIFYNYFTPGGLRMDIHPDFVLILGQLLDTIEKFYKDSAFSFIDNHFVRKRLSGTGIINIETAKNDGYTGPVLRACGIEYDIRKNAPYSIYNDIEFDVPTGSFDYGNIGGAFNRTVVRVKEIGESIRIIRQIYEDIPSDSTEGVDLNEIKIPGSACYNSVESARGELGYFIFSTGDIKPYRIKVRAPSFVHIQAVPAISKGRNMQDLPIIISSLDLSISEVDR